jgi:hypothetical protein
MNTKLTILVLGDLDSEPGPARFFGMLRSLGHKVQEQYLYGSDWFGTVDLNSERLDAIYVLPSSAIDATEFSRFVVWIKEHSDFVGYLAYLFCQKETSWMEVRAALSGLKDLPFTPDACPAVYDSMCDAWKKEQPRLMRMRGEVRAAVGALKILWGGIFGLSILVAVWLAGTIQTSDAGWWYHWFTR